MEDFECVSDDEIKATRFVVIRDDPIGQYKKGC